VSDLFWGRGGIRFMGRNLMSRWSAGWRTRRFVSRASEVDGVGVRDGNVLVCSVHGLGFGSSVTVVVRVDESSERVTA
jgi:hypothetical protein